VLNAVDLPYLDQFEQIDFLAFDPTIKRTEGTLKGPDGKVFKTTKGGVTGCSTCPRARPAVAPQGRTPRCLRPLHQAKCALKGRI
jgi:hypothetical protein